MATRTETRKTRADYAALPEGAPYQLVDGELITTPAPTPYHQEVVLTLATRLRSFVETQEAGVVYVAPLDVYLAKTEAYQPDLLFISNDRRGIISDDGIEGAPDLVAEVLSPSTAYHDLTKKKRVYEEAGVREYWVVDPEDRTVTVYENAEHGFTPISKAHETGSAQSQLLSGFHLTLDALF